MFGFGKSTLHTFAAYVIDWQQGGPGGMQTNRGHRTAIHNPHYDQAGHALTPFSGSGFGPQVSSQVLANIENPPVFVTGAIFEDTNGSGFYESGEGLSNVRFVFAGAAGTFSTTGFASGGYQIELPPGTYTATATGGGMKFEQRMTNIEVGATSVWHNWIYDPDVIPPDSLEVNNSTGSATDLGSSDTSRTGLNLHSSADVDFFRFRPNGNGSAQVVVSFNQTAGDVDVQLLNSAGSVVASSASSSSNEAITHDVARDEVYFIRVFGKSGSRSEGYSLQLTLPSPAPPTAMPDRAILNGAASVTVNVLANDMDLDGDRTKLIPNLVSGTPPEFAMSGKNVVYTPAATTNSGVHRANYTVTDDQGLTSASAAISVFVVDFSAPTPWMNTDDAFDVNDDGATSAIDALLVINDLNLRDSRRLPTGPAGAENLFGFLDASGDGFVSPLDALLVINRLNADAGGEGQGGGDGVSQETSHYDFALASLAAELELKRRRR